MVSDTPNTDVLVVGSGGAGIRSAISAAKRNVEVTLVSKGTPTKTGASALAGADFTLDGNSLNELGYEGEPEDTKERFKNDIVTQGFYLNDQDLVDLYIENAPERIEELIERGVTVDRDSERAIFADGFEAMQILFRWAKEEGVDFREDTMIIDLLTHDGEISGALMVDIKTGQIEVMNANSVILATGGWHKAYDFHAGSRELAGDGQAMAYRAGAEVGNMEFVTFASPWLLWPKKFRGSILTYVLSLLFGGGLVNSDGERFLRNYDSFVVEKALDMEWNKSMLSIAIQNEIDAGRGSPHGGVYFSTGDMTFEEFDEAVRARYMDWEYKGHDFSDMAEMLKSGNLPEVGPAAEYFEGGVVVNDAMESSVPGLFAAGECSMSGFGSNRVAAATTEMLVTGAKAGESAAEFAENTARKPIDDSQVDEIVSRIEQPLHQENGIRTRDLLTEIQNATTDKMGPVRDEERLREFISLIDDVRENKLPRLSCAYDGKEYNKEWIESLELRNIIQVLELSAKAAKKREESRGVHYRSDFPETDNDYWLKSIRARRGVDGPRFRTEAIDTREFEPPEGSIPYFDMMKSLMKAHSPTGGHH